MTDDGGNAEVGDFDPTGRVEEQLLGLDVAVNDLAFVGEFKGFAKRRANDSSAARDCGKILRATKRSRDF